MTPGKLMGAFAEETARALSVHPRRSRTTFAIRSLTRAQTAKSSGAVRRRDHAGRRLRRAEGCRDRGGGRAAGQGQSPTRSRPLQAGLQPRMAAITAANASSICGRRGGAGDDARRDSGQT